MTVTPEMLAIARALGRAVPRADEARTPAEKARVALAPYLQVGNLTDDEVMQLFGAFKAGETESR